MERFDHIIIGGGILGCSIAYHLAQKGAQSVAVLERNELAGAASSRAAGLILHVTGKKANTPLVEATSRAVAQLERELGEAIGFHAVGSLRIAASPKRAAELQSLAQEAAVCGISAVSLTREEAKVRAPWLGLPAHSEILFMPDDGYVDPYLLAMAYAQAARGRGVTFRLRTAVSDIVIENGNAVGVKTTANEHLFADQIVDAAGAWAAVVAAQAGHRLAMAPVRSHYWITESDTIFGGDHPVTLLPDAAAYTRPETGGLVLGVQEPQSKTFDARDLPDDPSAFSPTTGEEHWDILAERAEDVAPFFPGIMRARFSGYVAGLSTYTPDGHILLGQVPGLNGFFAAAGCCGSGIALSGGIGDIMSDLMQGTTPKCDIEAFDPSRFGVVDPFNAAFQEQCALARATKSRSA